VDIVSVFASRLKKLREQKGLSQRELAKKVNIAHSTLGMYEIGEREPDFKITSRLASYLGTSIDYLVGNSDDPRPVEEITDAHQRIEDALADDPDAEDLLNFWMELKEREDLFLLFKQVRPLSDDSIRRVIRVIKAIEDEEAREFGDGV
jgi:transcriptional regulator with XRE-family HTH domain